MEELTTHQRMTLMFEHKEADRVPIWDSPWAGTISRWHREGMPEQYNGETYVDYFGLDKIGGYSPDNSPRYPFQILSQTDYDRTYTTAWGATQRELIGEDTTPEFLDFKIHDPETWKEAKERIQPTEDRINWAYLKNNYQKWLDEGYWKVAGFWFGFDVTHSWMCGTENVLIGMMEEPEWCADMFNHLLDVHIALFEKILNEGYTFDCIRWPDDMGYKNNQFFSLKTYRELLEPAHKKAADWAHSKGMKVMLHSCGDVRPFIPDLVDIGINSLNPIEVKAGMDPVFIKETYGKDLVLHGGINAVLWDDVPKLKEEITRVLPVLKKDGGYIFSTDHSIPNIVHLEDFREVIDLVKKLGSY